MAAAKKVLIAARMLVGPFGKIDEGKVIPREVPNMSKQDWQKTVKSWANDGHAVTKDSDEDVGHWNEDGDPMDDLPENPLEPNVE